MSARKYGYSLRLYHGLIGAGVLTTFGFVQAAKRTKDKPTIGFGLLSAAFIAGFIYNRFIKSKDKDNEVPEPLKGTELISQISNYGLYSCMIFMPITGIAMGIFSGYGVPFFFTNIPGVKNPNKEISNNAYYSHKKVGKVFEGLVAIHIIATAYYYFNGIPTIPRISPFDEDDDDK